MKAERLVLRECPPFPKAVRGVVSKNSTVNAATGVGRIQAVRLRHCLVVTP